MTIASTSLFLSTRGAAVKLSQTVDPSGFFKPNTALRMARFSVIARWSGILSGGRGKPLGQVICQDKPARVFPIKCRPLQSCQGFRGRIDLSDPALGIGDDHPPVHGLKYFLDPFPVAGHSADRLRRAGERGFLMKASLLRGPCCILFSVEELSLFLLSFQYFSAWSDVGIKQLTYCPIRKGECGVNVDKTLFFAIEKITLGEK